MENFTSIEQSKRLLELGIPVDSADCVYDCVLIGGEKCYWLSILVDMSFLVYKRIHENSYTDIIPCWSAGQLIHIALSYRKPNKLGHIWMDISEDEMTLIECLINQIRVDIEQEIADFCKWRK